MRKERQKDCSTMKNNPASTLLKNNASAEIKPTDWPLGKNELKDHILIRLGYKRMKHLVEPVLFSSARSNIHMLR